MRRWPTALAVVLCAGAICGEAAALGPVQVPGLQVALYRYGFYKGPIDGLKGPMTTRALVDFQRARGLEADGVAGPRTRAAFGPLGRPLFGSRMLYRGMVGFDVSVLQFLLSRHGFAPDSLNSNFGVGTEQRVREFQRSVGLPADGVVGRQTRAALLAGPRQRQVSDSGQRRHVVQAGDTLTSIAARYGTTVDAIARQNGLDPRGLLVCGRTLVIPAARTTARRG